MQPKGETLKIERRRIGAPETRLNPMVALRLTTGRGYGLMLFTPPPYLALTPCS